MVFAPWSGTEPPLTHPTSWAQCGGCHPSVSSSPQVPVDDDYFLGSEAVLGDQPIYANMQGPSEDNLYIIADQ